MYTSEYFFSETTTTTTTPSKPRKIPVNAEDAPVKETESVKEPAAPQQKEAPTETKSAPAPPRDAPVAKEPISLSPSAREAVLAADIQRLQAEYVNYRKRVERDRDQARAQGIQSGFEKLLPVLDDISAARKYGDLQDGPFAAIANKLDATVRDMGFTVIDQAGVPFDPNIHETVMMQASDEIPADHIVMVLRDGYVSGDKTIRAAQVMVSAG
jgi:molecular chaperone GrpE